jgi:hypothetical protein
MTNLILIGLLVLAFACVAVAILLKTNVKAVLKIPFASFSIEAKGDTRRK